MARRYQQVDVFGERPFFGNPVAVVFDAEGLSTDQMQQVARWTNLSETTFLLRPTSSEADYRVRIFTLTHELPFAGHPTLGSCHAWLVAGGQPRRSNVVVQECGVGLVFIERGPERLAFAAPALLRSGPVEEHLLQELAVVLGVARETIIDSQWVDNGPGWVGLLFNDAATVLAIEPDFGRYTGSDNLDIGLVGPYPPGSEYAFEVRALFSDDTRVMREDPVTGSLNASLAQWLLETSRAEAPFVTSQGTRLGRLGRPFITQQIDGSIWVGGTTVTCAQGEISI